MTTTRERTRRRRISKSVFNLQVRNTPEYTKERHTEIISSGAFSLSPGGGTKDFYMNIQSNAVRAMQAVIPIMRKQRSGKIVNITSMGGRIAIPLDSIYHATKFALEGLSKSIQYEVEPFGIKIILIEPGAVSSNFWKNMKSATKPSESESTDSPYSQMKIKISEALNRAVQNAIHPSEVAKAILEAVTSDNPDFRYAVGKDATMTMEARKNMPDREFQDLLKKQFNLQNVS